MVRGPQGQPTIELCLHLLESKKTRESHVCYNRDMNVSIHVSMQTIHRRERVQELFEQLDPNAPPQALVSPGSPLPRDEIIVFPGSFNPPTTAHLALLKQARHFARLEALRGRESMQLYAALSKHIVDKETVERPLLLDRILLLDNLLRRRFPRVGILLFNRGLYVEQAQAVHTSFPHVRRLLFLMGFDKIVQVLDPHYYKDRDAALHDLFALAELLVAPRGNEGEHSLDELLQRPENRPFARYIHTLPFDPAYREISSTQVRQHASTQRGEIPHEVLRFMRKTRAYAPPLRLPDGSEIDIYAERVKLLESLLKNVSSEK
jgi:nicotinic acid mononucleotide adenylyltransferase